MAKNLHHDRGLARRSAPVARSCSRRREHKSHLLPVGAGCQSLLLLPCAVRSEHGNDLFRRQGPPTALGLQLDELTLLVGYLEGVPNVKATLFATRVGGAVASPITLLINWAGQHK